MAQHDGNGGPGGPPHESTTVAVAMAAVVRAARRVLASEPIDAAEIHAALAQATRAAAACGLRADGLLAALDQAIARAGADAPEHEQERLRATVAALALRAHLGEPP